MLKKLPEKGTSTKPTAFAKLNNYVQSNIIEQGEIIKMINNYKELISENDEEQSGLRASNLKHRLENHFGEKLLFWAPKGKSGIVYCEEKQFQGNSLYLKDKENLVEDCAKIIREKISEISEPFLNWPPNKNELLSCKIGIPPLLGKLLTFIISSTKEKTERKTRLVSSIAQDLIYATSGGEKDTKTSPAWAVY